MKMNSVSLPKVMDYYISLKYKELLNDKFLKGDCEVVDNKLYIVIDYNPDLFACLRLYLEKIKKTTIGNNIYAYEYELDIKAFKGDQDFIIYLEDGTHVCTLEGSYIDDKNCVLIFKMVT